MDFEHLAIPIPSIADLHWKIGDRMGDDDLDFIIHNIAVVSRGGPDFDIIYFDENGKAVGRQKVTLRGE